MKEADLFEPVKYYLEKQGYKVRGEVLSCDITATRGEELVVIELKTRFNLALVMQAVKRQESADSVYVAVPVPPQRRYPANFKGICRLLKRLELGLILVKILKTKTGVEIMFHPTEYKKRCNIKYRQNLIREINGRFRNFNRGGSTSRIEKITAYKQQVIEIACYLELLGKASPAGLKKLGTGNKTNAILSRNFYGWFQRIARGIYTLHPQGKKALAGYPELVSYFTKKYKQNSG